ncbi:MAG: hypothetical protein K8T90_01560 [Planctomycetes bacterium]|nr:hypothetical protein [Planctomycetota bacterium]
MSELASPRALLGQETALQAFSAALATGRVAGSYLLHGPAGTGRTLGATLFANALLCERPKGLEPCRSCRACRRSATGTHPDLLVVAADTGPRFDDDADAARAGTDRFTRAARSAAKPGPRKTISVRVLRRLLEILSLASAHGGWKVAIIDAFDEVEEEGAALLLKTLEEAPPRTTFLLLSRGTDGVPDTILSRSQRVRFRPIPPATVRAIAAAHGGDAVRELPPSALDLLIRLAQGSPGRAIRAAQMGLIGMPADVLRTLGSATAPAEELLPWVRDAGKELESQRERVREALALGVVLCRDAWTSGGDSRLVALRTAFESLDANVPPEWVLRALWIRAARARSLTI